jgi:hypothetical protein
MSAEIKVGLECNALTSSPAASKQRESVLMPPMYVPIPILLLTGRILYGVIGENDNKSLIAA